MSPPIARLWIATAICRCPLGGWRDIGDMQFDSAEAAHEQDRVGGELPDEPSPCCFGKKLLDEFQEHAARLRRRSHARRQAMTLKSAVLDRDEREETSADDMLGRRQPQDEFQGDVNMRTLQALLKRIDEAGFERSPHQVRASPHTTPCSLHF